MKLLLSKSDRNVIIYETTNDLCVLFAVALRNAHKKQKTKYSQCTRKPVTGCSNVCINWIFTACCWTVFVAVIRSCFFRKGLIDYRFLWCDKHKYNGWIISCDATWEVTSTIVHWSEKKLLFWLCGVSKQDQFFTFFSLFLDNDLTHYTQRLTLIILQKLGESKCKNIS